MEHHFVIPKLPLGATLAILVILVSEMVGYGLTVPYTSEWLLILFSAFYVTYIAIFRRDALPAVYGVVFFTAYHVLFLNLNLDFSIALLFLIIFFLNSAIMYFLLHYATHLKQEYHLAYSIISGFMIAQILTLFASMSRDWPFRLELAAFIPAVFSYIFWRFACLAADSVLGWKQFVRVGGLVLILTILIILGSPNIQV